MYLNDNLYICIYTYLDRQSCRFFFATFEFHITLFLFPWYNIYYDHCHLDISLSHSGYPSTNHHHQPATAAIISVVQWYSCWLPGWLSGWLASLLACWLACLLPCLLPCFPGTPVCGNLAGKIPRGGRIKFPVKIRVPTGGWHPNGIDNKIISAQARRIASAQARQIISAQASARPKN